MTLLPKETLNSKLVPESEMVSVMKYMLRNNTLPLTKKTSPKFS